jgi:hypothetical protein
MELEKILKDTKKTFIVCDKEDEDDIDMFFLITDIDAVWIRGVVLKFCAMDACNKKNQYVEFLTSFYIKWDGCSHFYFTGEDSLQHKEEENDSYYHICGAYSYIIMVNTLLASLAIAEKLIKNAEDLSCDYSNALMKVFDDHYLIKEVENDKYNLSTYEN